LLPDFTARKKAENLLIGWGSTYGVIKETAETLNKNGGSYSHLHLSQIWPFPTGSSDNRIEKCKAQFRD